MSTDFVLRISQLAHDGRGIGFLPDGKTVFVMGALPGQTVACRLTRAKKNYCEAALAAKLEENPDFSVPFCRHSSECGGCPLQQMPYMDQLFWKHKLARDAFLRIGGFSQEQFDAAWQSIEGAPALQAFRNKVELAFGNDRDGQLILGYRNRASHQVFALADCALIDASAQPIIADCQKLAAASGLPAYEGKGFWRFLILRQGMPGQLWHALLITSAGSAAQRKIALELGRKLLSCQPQLASFILEERRRNDVLARGETRIAALGEPELALELGGRKFLADAASFFQVNSSASELLANVIMRLDRGLAPGPLLDVYCGVGAPGQLLTARHETCLGLEVDKRSVVFARRNAADLNNWRYEAGDAARRLEALDPQPRKWPALLLDPPRAGLDRKALAAIMRLKPASMLYVSCNPPTMARDAKILAEQYNLDALAAVDMFPHTPHLECVGLWQRR